MDSLRATLNWHRQVVLQDLGQVLRVPYRLVTQLLGLLPVKAELQVLLDYLLRVLDKVAPLGELLLGVVGLRLRLHLVLPDVQAFPQALLL